MVPLSQIRALTTEQTQHASNRRSEGFWNVAPASMGGGLYRIVNNTATCTGPWLAIFRDAPPDLEWAPIQVNPRPAPAPAPRPPPPPQPPLSPPRYPSPPTLSPTP